MTFRAMRGWLRRGVVKSDGPLVFQRIMLEHPIAVMADEEISITVLDRHRCKVTIARGDVAVSTEMNCTIQAIKYKEWTNL